MPTLPQSDLPGVSTRIVLCGGREVRSIPQAHPLRTYAAMKARDCCTRLFVLPFFVAAMFFCFRTSAELYSLTLLRQRNGEKIALQEFMIEIYETYVSNGYAWAFARNFVSLFVVAIFASICNDILWEGSFNPKRETERIVSRD